MQVSGSQHVRAGFASFISFFNIFVQLPLPLLLAIAQMFKPLANLSKLLLHVFAIFLRAVALALESL